MQGTMEESVRSKYEAAVEMLESRLDDLAIQADETVHAHWNRVKDMENRSPGWENKSNLLVRCVKAGNSLRLDWSGIRWYGSKAKGTREPKRIHIRKPESSYSYSLKKLYEHCKEWEKPLVKDTEEKLVVIRREARHVTKALQQIRFAREAGKRPPVYDTAEEVTE
jgi:hypothetical protein